MFNYAKYHKCAITYTLNLSNHIRCWNNLAFRAPKARTRKRYDVQNKLANVNNAIVNCTTCIIRKPIIS